MQEMIVMVHKIKKTAYASGNKQFFDKSKEQLFSTIKGNNHGDNKNFLGWAKTFSSENDLDFVIVSCPKKGGAKVKSKQLISKNSWREISKNTRERSS